MQAYDANPPALDRSRGVPVGPGTGTGPGPQIENLSDFVLIARLQIPRNAQASGECNKCVLCPSSLVLCVCRGLSASKNQ